MWETVYMEFNLFRSNYAKKTFEFEWLNKILGGLK